MRRGREGGEEVRREGRDMGGVVDVDAEAGIVS